MDCRPLANGVKPIREIEKKYIFRALITMNWNRFHTAKALGICTRTLRQKIRVLREAGLPCSKAEVDLVVARENANRDGVNEQ